MEQSQVKRKKCGFQPTCPQVTASKHPQLSSTPLQPYLNSFNNQILTLSSILQRQLRKNNMRLAKYLTSKAWCQAKRGGAERQQQCEDENFLEDLTRDYCKALFAYCSRSKRVKEVVLQKLGVDMQEFREYLRQQEGAVSSLADLRAVCYDRDNPFAKVFRVLVLEYSRKCRLADIFCFRRHNYGEELQYRRELVGLLEEGPCGKEEETSASE